MIGKRLLELRRNANLTQDQLSEILKINKHSISSYERDKNEPSDDIKIAIADFFDVSVDYLVGVTVSKTRYKPNKKYMELPEDFPEKAGDMLKEYAEFLEKKYKE